MAVTIDRAALKALLNLAALGARTEGATFTPRTMQVWQDLAKFATAPGDVILSTASPVSSLQGAGRWIAVGEAAERMGVSEQHVRKLCRLGALRARRAGNRVWLIDEDAVTGWRRAA